MLDTVVISGEDVCCSVVFGTLVGVLVFSVMWSELLMMTSIISCPLWSSVFKCHKVEFTFTSWSILSKTLENSSISCQPSCCYQSYSSNYQRH